MAIKWSGETHSAPRRIAMANGLNEETLFWMRLAAFAGLSEHVLASGAAWRMPKNFFSAGAFRASCRQDMPACRAVSQMRQPGDDRFESAYLPAAVFRYQRTTLVQNLDS
ncbi:MAG: hypothetical protein HT580_07705 [Dechloromonas sp.]|nr:MAG: hypothetical protein HT580_07705 [Dechloromonas sp.]